MNSKAIKNRKKKKKQVYVFFSMISLIAIIFLIIKLLSHIQELQSGSSDNILYLWITLEILGLLIIPLISNPNRWNTISKNISKKQEKRQKLQLDLKIKRKVYLDSHYSPNLIIKCPFCGFDNPKNTKKCFNCQAELEF